MKKEFLSYAKVVLSSMIAATVIITVRYCLYAGNKGSGADKQGVPQKGAPCLLSGRSNIPDQKEREK